MIQTAGQSVKIDQDFSFSHSSQFISTSVDVSSEILTATLHKQEINKMADML
jgi:hypothetical protein